METHDCKIKGCMHGRKARKINIVINDSFGTEIDRVSILTRDCDFNLRESLHIFAFVLGQKKRD